jgi:protocatechuate 3,4-dioxygenase beta subunit
VEHDHQEPRVSRRRLIGGIGSLGLGGLVTGCGPRGFAPEASLLSGARTCVLTPETTQGPYYFDAGKIRSDIREGRPGVRLGLAIKVEDGTTCKPLPDAVVDIWHCDASGIYSGAEKLSKRDHRDPPSAADISEVGGKGGMPDLRPADGTRYLRGAQVSGRDGVVRFTTIWPGWYPGRTVHIHVMVHVSDKRVLSTQLMFDEALNRKVMARPPYSEHRGRDTYNGDDGIFREGMVMEVAEDGDGYLGAVILSAPS